MFGKINCNCLVGLIVLRSNAVTTDALTEKTKLNFLNLEHDGECGDSQQVPDCLPCIR